MIKRDRFGPKLSPNHPFTCRIYPKMMIAIIGMILVIEVKKSDIGILSKLLKSTAHTNLSLAKDRKQIGSKSELFILWIPLQITNCFGHICFLSTRKTLLLCFFSDCFCYFNRNICYILEWWQDRGSWLAWIDNTTQ